MMLSNLHSINIYGPAMSEFLPKEIFEVNRRSKHFFELFSNYDE